MVHELASDHPVPLEELLDARRKTLRRRRRDLARVRRDERPAAGELGGEAALDRPAAARVAHGRRAEDRAERVEAVVRDLTGPHEIPEGVRHVRCEAAAERDEKLREEERAACSERLADALMDGALLRRGDRRESRVLREVEGELPIARTDRPAADPDDRSGCEQRVEVALVVAGDARREDPRLEV